MNLGFMAIAGPKLTAVNIRSLNSGLLKIQSKHSMALSVMKSGRFDGSCLPQVNTNQDLLTNGSFEIQDELSERAITEPNCKSDHLTISLNFNYATQHPAFETRRKICKTDFELFTLAALVID